MESTLELRKKEIQSFKAVEKESERLLDSNDYKEFELLNELGMTNTPKYKELSKKIELDQKIKENIYYNKSIEQFEKEGFKILTSEFVESFCEKYNLMLNRSLNYVMDIPTTNLININKKIDKYLKTCFWFKPSPNHVTSPNKIDNLSSEKKKGKENICTKFLYIIAPEGHFEEKVPLVDPNPVALLALDKHLEHFIYLDAWDLEKIMFDNEINNSEFLN